MTMPAIPLPFIISAFLIFLFVRMKQQKSGDGWFRLFVGLSALQTALVGLRWSLNPSWVAVVQPVLASCLPPIAWAGFITLRERKMSSRHGLWPFIIVAAWWFFPALIDPLLILEYLLYAWLIFRLTFSNGIIDRVRIGDEWTLLSAKNAIAALFVLSALGDALIAIALSTGQGSVATPLIAAIMGLVLLGLVAILMRRTSETIPAAGSTEPTPIEPQQRDHLSEEEEQTIIAMLEAVLSQGLYRDYNLTLQRLARRIKIPARKISQAVNHRLGCTVTDLVNKYRVAEAMRLLAASDLSITQIMLEAGFQTKSNFNRAFKTITDQTPRDYRRRALKPERLEKL